MSLLEFSAQLLTPLYRQPNRHYHGLIHVLTLLRLLNEHAPLARSITGVALAIWFHDAIYDSTRDDNEVQSALLAERTLPAWGCSEALTDSVSRKVLATQGHAWTDGDPDTALFLDLDLSILAAPAEDYQRYTQQIEKEYAWVPQQAYRERRAKVLRSFLDRASLYFTPSLRAQWEPVARQNLADELSTLA